MTLGLPCLLLEGYTGQRKEGLPSAVKILDSNRSSLLILGTEVFVLLGTIARVSKTLSSPH
jgi:hypothetical protein